MEFIKIKALWKDYPDNLYRVFLFKKDITLEEVNYYICLLIKGRLTDEVVFKGDNDTFYGSTEFSEIHDTIPYEDIKLSDALDKFKQLTFRYDPEGDDYEFIVKRASKNIYEYPIKTDCLLVEAKGDGIIDGNISKLYDIMENEEEVNSLGFDYYHDFDFDAINREIILENIDFPFEWHKPDGLSHNF